MNECIIEKVNGLFKYIHPSDYRNALIEIANSFTQETDIEIYTDGSMKNIVTNEIMMGCAFVVNTFDDLNFLMIKNIERSKVNYKRKPDLYDKDWRCNFCKIEEETFDHFWKCSKIQNVVEDILKQLKIFLVKIIQEYSRDDINTQELKSKINELNMWDIGCLYDFTFLMKNQVSCQLIELLRCYKITEEKLLYKVLKQIIGRVLLEFKMLIWELRNELQIKEEKRCGISGKDKKAKSHSKH
ncbi:hypothetical protein RhiirC2_799627 [Rhizophagus irregularis]|uniref:Reverse transcriptase zinc-binding domain-containing protein n=1 Tax=Rhizophagus irregularis TaxID=588596 RepID=A0A2N1M4S2_9GLOM|nr:hypothetical protein RhiirC2_799627 [Rhizophagus irregularis]